MSPDLENQPAEEALLIQLPEAEQDTPVSALPAVAPTSPRVEHPALRWLPTRRWLIHPDGGMAWSIEERSFADGPSLFFVNDAGFVRVRHYPLNWLELPDEALAALVNQPFAKPIRNS
ncbi:MAG TPA: hypothetical protein VH277_00800 [Gemmatimonadaceae bacterium]|nr:hypothetical protein [Gemmatimonadaceae bacterium]